MSVTAQVNAEVMEIMKGAWMEKQPINSPLPDYTIAYVITDTEVITYVFGVEDSREPIVNAVLTYGIASVYTNMNIYAWGLENGPLPYTFIKEGLHDDTERRSRGFTKWKTKKALRKLEKQFN